MPFKDMTTPASYPNTRIAWYSLGISLIVLALKCAAWKITGSVALQSDALETIINVVAALAGLYALSIAGIPPDENHTYGHYKAEYLCAVAEGVLVITMAGFICYEAWHSLWHPRAPDASVVGIAFNVAATLLNFLWARTMIRIGHSRRSPALVAGGQHILADVWTSSGIIAGFLLVPLTGWVQLDSVLAFIIALNVLLSGYNMMRHSISGLMDEAPDSLTLKKIQDIIAVHAAGAIEAHDIRVRIAGAITFIDFHLVVDGNMTVNESHQICDRAEKHLRNQIGNALISIHVEPEHHARRGDRILPQCVNIPPPHQHG